jgi:hypothetical protein
VLPEPGSLAHFVRVFSQDSQPPLIAGLVTVGEPQLTVMPLRPLGISGLGVSGRQAHRLPIA